MCHFNSVHYVNFEDLVRFPKIPEIRKTVGKKNRAKFRKIFPISKFGNSEKFVHFRCFHKHALRNRVHQVE
jgi:hypothetical protein